MAQEDDVRALLERLLANLRQPLESELRTLVEELVRKGTADRDRAVEQAVADAAADVRRQAQAQLAQLRDGARQQLETARKTADAEVAAIRQKAAAEIEDSRRIAQAQVEELERTNSQRLAESHAHLERLRRDVEEARAERDHARAETEQVRAEAVRTQRQIEIARHEIEELRTRAAADAEALLIAQLAAAEHHERTNGGQENGDERRGRAELLEAVRSLDEARSLGDVLARLAQHAAREVDRTAVLVVKGQRLHGWRFVGFDGLDGRVEIDGTEANAPPFAAGAGVRDSVALPVTLDGHVVAILYADALRRDHSGGRGWPAILEVLARHASRVLESMTIQQSLGLSARVSHASEPATGHEAGRVQ